MRRVCVWDGMPWSRDGGAACLRVFLGERREEPSDGVGYVYILSTREQRDLLKIGYTERPVEIRVHEINAATGVAVPFGVRAVWKVRQAGTIEGQIHELLAAHRIRRDREFFRIDFNQAFLLVRDYIYKARIEM